MSGKQVKANRVVSLAAKRAEKQFEREVALRLQELAQQRIRRAQQRHQAINLVWVGIFVTAMIWAAFYMVTR